MKKPPISDDGGSLTVELVVVTPVLVVLALTMLIFGRVSVSRQEVVEAARAGAQAAAVLPNASSAQMGAAIDAAVGIANQAHACKRPQIAADVSHFYPGGYVTVTVVCKVELSDIAFPGMPGSTTVQASTTAPIDPYRSVG
jgi:Flp pilus assembly protein TadG